MSTAPIPRLVDLRKLAAFGGEMSGEIPLSALERVAAECEHDHHPVTVKLEFGIDEDKVRYARGTVSASMPMQCQRCLGTVVIKADAAPNLAMVWSEEQIVDLPRRYDGIVVGSEPVDLYELIEDELLLCMPLAPRHAENECEAMKRRFGDEEEAPKTERPNPFGVLAALKKSES